ncbi:helix-turn-helix transcriptional regulator [Thalassospira sp.]|uniref:helix-turn-helix domain-containing protein n=1 Tax=Thalassospira sp. TaxID=1912094 RepID=UPI001B2B7B18|nr:helix-turn-helix transcriptional regulator [Thalassospira sp.]MBO6808422.1 helix-turn-helix transcriptional regulator [Thalassospira sp.]MBO6839880.1 helix-turn-helix transcriptional regulator [Thalassospira sp.]
MPVGNDIPGYDPELGTRLKWIVGRIGTQKRAGEIAQVKPEMIAKYISGRAKPSFYAIMSLASAAGVSLDWLAYGTTAALQANSIDEEVLLASIQAVENDLHERGETMQPDDKSRLIYLLYRTRMKEKDQNLTESRSVLSSLFGKSRNGRTGRSNTPDELLEIPQRQRSRKQGTDE